jgi:hypothetical protein
LRWCVTRFVCRGLVRLLAAGVAVAGVSGAWVASALGRSGLATDQLSWRSEGRIDSTGLAGLSCPAASLCVGVDSAGNILTTTKPGAGAGAWKRAFVDSSSASGGPNELGQAGLTDVSCPSVSLCVAVDSAGNAFVSRRPLDGVGAWTGKRIDAASDSCPVEGGYEPCQPSLTAISCPSASLCVAVDSGGRALSSTDPGGEGAWSSADADPVSYENSGYHEDVHDSLTSLSCPATALCVGGDNAGNVITSTDPAGDGRAWTITHVDPALQGDGYGVNDISCPSVSLCVAVDGAASDVITSTHPTGGPSAWTVTRVGNDTYALSSIWCPFLSLCVAADEGAGNVASTTPMGGARSWTPTARYGSSSLSALACPSRALCVAVDANGNLAIGTPAPAARRGLLRGTIQPGGGPPPVRGQPRKGLAGEVSVFSPGGRLIARQRVRAGHRFHFKLAPGRYLLNAGRHLRYSAAKGCRPVTARVQINHTTTANVYTGCSTP